MLLTVGPGFFLINAGRIITPINFSFRLIYHGEFDLLILIRLFELVIIKKVTNI